MSQAAAAADELPRVVLIGDSIRLGYTPRVTELLAGKGVVISPAQNGGDSANVLAHLDEWVLALSAPRPLLCLTGELDAGSPVDGVRAIEKAVGATYRALGSGDRFRSVLYPEIGHPFTPHMRTEMLAWFQRWLRPREGAAPVSRSNQGSAVSSIRSSMYEEGGSSASPRDRVIAISHRGAVILGESVGLLL